MGGGRTCQNILHWHHSRASGSVWPVVPPNALQLRLKLVSEVLSSLQLLQRLRLLPLQLLLLLSQSGRMGRLMLQLTAMVFLGPRQPVLLSFDTLLPGQELFIEVLHDSVYFASTANP